MCKSTWIQRLAKAVVFGAATLFGAAGAVAAPILIDFSDGPLGQFGGPTFIEVGTGLEARGFYFNGGWQDANLFRRDDVEDRGLGVCNPQETCISLTSEGNINELDNRGQDELIRLALPDGYRWVEVGVSSLDSGDGAPERGELYADIDEDLDNGFGAPFLQFQAEGPVDRIFSIVEGYQLAPYLIFRPFDWSGSANPDNDYLVHLAVIEQVQVPEPASVTLLAAGLALVALGKRRRGRS